MYEATHPPKADSGLEVELTPMTTEERLERLEDWCQYLEEELRRMVEVTASAGTVLRTAAARAVREAS